MPEPIYICGPTASGKSTLALELAGKLGGEIVNADAFQLYRGAPVLTAAPSAAELETVPHHLYGVLDPTEACDAMRYREMALPVIEEIRGRGLHPIVTGGSGLYLKFLSHGPSPLPPGDPALRRKLDERPLESLVEELAQRDPLEASRTDSSNRRYVSRALEVCLLSGRPCSELRDRWESRSREIEGSLWGLVVRRQRSDLHQRIDERTRRMLTSGAFDEVAGLPAEMAGFEKAIGIQQIREHLGGRITLADCRERIAAATRQYAKRQETWFRRESWLHAVPWPPASPPPLDVALRALSNRF
ncbi:tRNA (adenosine(37)-N6)-dimethylallyltransferase MiaA [Haloferula sp. A504]|uniref:tRNA (adenosine(37)-N6)-dimethylallyltransferase MiaA n=1 Tax=Haloferula sp. A504 TaxID=3373601 RepID=UPI0031CBD235|nr:tRNA (adenosine(37)-N6)-dimethylallyltransferase MiaA [Verrucomicrobiaceae bacterium E54]